MTTHDWIAFVVPASIGSFVIEETRWYQSSAGASLHAGGAHIQHMLTCVVKYRGIS